MHITIMIMQVLERMKKKKSQELTMQEREDIASDLCIAMDNAAEQVSKRNNCMSCCSGHRILRRLHMQFWRKTMITACHSHLTQRVDCSSHICVYKPSCIFVCSSMPLTSSDSVFTSCLTFGAISIMRLQDAQAVRSDKPALAKIKLLKHVQNMLK